jgi:hypothetical protein
MKNIGRIDLAHAGRREENEKSRRVSDDEGVEHDKSSVETMIERVRRQTKAEIPDHPTAVSILMVMQFRNQPRSVLRGYSFLAISAACSHSRR